MKNRKFLIFGFLVILAVTIVCLWASFKMKETIGPICREDTYTLASYTQGYNPEEKEKQIFISNQKDTDKLMGILSTDDISSLDTEKYDYLIYFLNEHHGCDRVERLNCIEYDKEGITLKISAYKIDTTCDITFTDSFIIELDKDKYDKDLKVEVVKE